MNLLFFLFFKNTESNREDVCSQKHQTQQRLIKNMWCVSHRRGGTSTDEMWTKRQNWFVWCWWRSGACSRTQLEFILSGGKLRVTDELIQTQKVHMEQKWKIRNYPSFLDEQTQDLNSPSACLSTGRQEPTSTVEADSNICGQTPMTRQRKRGEDLWASRMLNVNMMKKNRCRNVRCDVWVGWKTDEGPKEN